MMILESRKIIYTCPNCEWRGKGARLSLCSDCGTTFYKCPVCGKRVDEAERW